MTKVGKRVGEVKLHDILRQKPKLIQVKLKILKSNPLTVIKVLIIFNVRKVIIQLNQNLYRKCCRWKIN